MRAFRNPLLTWIVEHPRLSTFAFVGLVLFLVALLPMRKVPLIYNLRNLQNRWKTTLVTALAFTLVTFTLTGMLSFVKGMDRLIDSSGDPGNVMVLSDGATDEAFSNLPDYDVTLLPGAVQNEVLLFSKEVYVVVMYMIPNPPPGGRPRRFVQMRGLFDMRLAAEVHGVKLMEGHTFGSSSGVKPIGNNETAKEIVIGHGIARTFAADFGKPMLERGDVLTLGNDKWVVVGIMEEGSAAFSSEIWTRARSVQENFGRKDSSGAFTYGSYVVRTAGAEKANLAVEMLKDSKLVGKNFTAYTEREYYAKMNDTSKQFSVASWVVALIMALGGILGIMNTMYAAVSQRSKDIGVLRLMGYRRWQILLSFHFESMLIAILGGFLGLIVAFLAFDGLTVTSIISSGQGGGGKTVVLRLIFDLQVLAVGAIFTLYMGALGGFIPAFSAMRLRPLESLK